MIVERHVLGPLDTNCWVAAADADGPWIVIDPAGDEDALLRDLDGRVVGAVVLTHGHFDHLGAAGAVVAATGAPLLVGAADADRITDAASNGGAMFGFDHAAPAADRTLTDGDVVAVGALRFEVLATPGHTPGSICLHEPAHAELFSGDTLFAGSAGRTDFTGGDPHAMRASLARLAALPPETRVHAGHGPDTTIERERRLNPFFPRG